MHHKRFEHFIEEMNQFIFFHLGADAVLDVRRSEHDLQIRIEHPRITPIEVTFTPERIHELDRSPSEFEDCWLDLLTKYRRS